MSNTSALDNIGACVFDAYGTLFDVTSAAARCSDVLGDKASPLADIWRTKQLQYTWLRSLMGEWADFWQVTGDGLDHALSALDIDDAALRARLMDLYMTLDAYPEVISTLRILKSGNYKTAILSNGSQEMISAASRSASLTGLLDALISVDDVKIYKPHPSVYQMAVDRLGMAADKICFMSSNGWDVAGAANFGFKVVWVNRFGQKPERIPGKYLVEISTLNELPPLLGL
ncbi:MAG: haloacid dehalogenase type II [Rhodospirillales bacterium]|nr:haloacid dehalogenase type II [Rhodospirillales bacterium]